VLNVAGASVTVCPLTGQTATLATVLSTQATLTLGSGVTLTTPTVMGGQAEIQCSWTTLTVDDRADVLVSKAAASTTQNINSGTVTWRSTGGVGATNINSDGALDMDTAPAVVTAGTITVYSGATLTDNHKRLPASYTLVLRTAGWTRSTSAGGLADH
jgi:hypothetical protein